MNATAVPNPYNQPHPSPQRHRVASPAHWLALLAAPSAWIAQLLINTSMVTHGCYPHAVPLVAPVWSNLRMVSSLVTASALLICVAAGAVAWQNWQRTRSEKPGSAHELLASGDGRARFLAMVGMLSSGQFLIAVALTAVTLTTVPMCGR